MPDIVIMFFALGLIAGLVKSDLKVPVPIYETLSILLMLTIGLKGGMALHGVPLLPLLPELGSIILAGAVLPLVLYPVLRKLVKLESADAASIAAHYGSVSAGTFAVVLAVVSASGLAMSPQTTLYLVLLELPAIVMMLWLYRYLNGSKASGLAILHEALTSRGVLLLTGGLVIGALYGQSGLADISVVLVGGFKTLLALFLLEMGLCTAKVFQPLPWRQWRLMIFAIVTPMVLASFGLLLAALLSLPAGSALVLATLMASASYIAAPAAIRAAIPQADIGLALLASLGITFPFNILVGIPLYQSWLA
ncbi:sodium-dependent bicarbonate transport family permease [Alishewanella sp. 16-MA]|uniref:Sodium-dependent bicarbonate transport family permease n=1 Tax=Alishewanella maricola TaxID=2795740 RepID=A0ABS8C6U6_9ALTE|nr:MULTISPECIES: sodium-dependent bicarbonate transport family permease [Gammaproteobacteria]MCB5228049.1 sodium-dependent bicarbonate transport family permease [Alishewanella maricola]MCF4009530.1 sodium-dependent bicarbonate transport family permease [Rheinheimera sp. UJ63]MDP5037339.1 sodium-dependent bicarbonate transport family permease [Alishewanella sp.]